MFLKSLDESSTSFVAFSRSYIYLYEKMNHKGIILKKNIRREAKIDFLKQSLRIVNDHKRIFNEAKHVLNNVNLELDDEWCPQKWLNSQEYKCVCDFFGGGNDLVNVKKICFKCGKNVCASV